MSKDEAFKQALDALKRISDWNEHHVSLTLDYGSNGVRDYYRQIAMEALKQWNTAKQACCEALETKESEPFGYFKAEPFGWTDCAKTDEGAIALYETPQAPAVRFVSIERFQRVEDELARMTDEFMRVSIELANLKGQKE